MTHPLHGLPSDASVFNTLQAEFRQMPAGRRLLAYRKLVQREGLLWVSGQRRRQVARVPSGVRRLLWLHTWTTVGDAILDLAPRTLVPANVEVDLCIAPALAPLFATDLRFARVFDDPAGCGREHDFVLLDCLSTQAIRVKRRYFPNLPFASLRGHLLGERFDRAAFADRRIRQLFGLAAADPSDADVVAPSLRIEPAERVETVPPFRIAVALGARVGYKHYPHWPAAIEHILRGWPLDRPSPQFRLMGQGPLARADRDSVPLDVRQAACIDAVDAESLREAASQLAACDAFLGVDGGLMHIAAALQVPGVALFVGADPRYFLRPDSPIHPLRTDAPASAMKPEVLAQALVRRAIGEGFAAAPAPAAGAPARRFAPARSG